MKAYTLASTDKFRYESFIRILRESHFFARSEIVLND